MAVRAHRIRDTVDRVNIIEFRDWLADLLIESGGQVPYRGYVTKGEMGELQLFLEDGTEIEIFMRMGEQ